MTEESTPEPTAESAQLGPVGRRLVRIGAVVGGWFPVIVVIAGAIAVIRPAPFLNLSGAIPYLLMVIMLGMGMTLRGKDFALVAKRPRALVIGLAGQYLILPLVGLGLVWAFQLEPQLAVGVLLVAAAPGGTASNVITYLAKGDVALSVAMTAVSTALAPIMTPLLVLLLAGSYLPVNPASLMISILQLVLVPIVLGVLLRRFAGGFVDRITPALPLVSVIVITVVILAVVAGSADVIVATGLLVALVVILHNVIGLALGYAAARATRLDEPAARAVTIEIGMQNSGLAAGLAALHFSPVAALPAALFSVWHNVSGALLASWWSRRPPTEKTEAPASTATT